ncbi:hypothetical protein DQ04_08661020 [Trypanosoma grayi]|uniref:hypothetical protein n=1 Tax=Trypanosoma grayi TaxID=71804 RepID=UPI0004F40533|nr:hypothetical protein DQ04_08661020 [Trypanosoma grayi]KEG07846.1 hypothetical protein DQ04_08661020 [Trypanosoma grayi]
MHASVVTNVGLVVDAVILERCMDENEFFDESGHGIMFTGDSAHRTSFQPSLFGSNCPTPQRSSLVSFLSATAPQTPLSSTKTYAKLPSIINDNVHYECQATGKPLQQRIFHHFDVLPFGVDSPSSVFSVIGRHTNRGLVLGVTPTGAFVVRPYKSEVPLQLVPYGADRKTVRKEDLHTLGKLSSSPSVINGTTEFVQMATRFINEVKKSAAGDGDTDAFRQGHAESTEISESGSDVNVLEGTELWALKDMQLPPKLALHDPVPPLRVGSRVVARRFACDGALHLARVCAVHYDVTYTLRYESDNGVDMCVLHNDVHLFDESEAEQCSVRDKVTVALHKQLPAVIIECLGDEEYRVILENNPSHALTVTRRHIVFIAPLLKEALYGDPVILEWFRALDPTCSGLVSWKEVRHLILSWETYGQSFSFQKLGEVQRELCIRVGRMEPQLLRKVPVQEEEMLLGYAEFEYVILRMRNML